MRAKYLLATQGSQGVVALREMFASNIRVDDIYVVMCGGGDNGPLKEFVRYNNLLNSEHNSNQDFLAWFDSTELKFHTLISISWKYKFSASTLKRFEGRSINFHPGLLPEYKGCFSTPWSIINGEEYVGYSYHYMTEEFDDGRLLLTEKIPIKDYDTAHSLNYKIFQNGLSKLGDVINLIGSEGVAQEGEGKYYKNELPFDGRLDLSWPLKNRNRFRRAMYFPPHETSLDLEKEPE